MTGKRVGVGAGLVGLALGATSLAACVDATQSNPPPVSPTQAPVASSAPSASSPASGACSAQAACDGAIAKVAGLAAAEDATLLAQAHGDPGKGGVCRGAVFKAEAAVKLYRLFGGPARERGRWWSLAKPAGTADAYRQKYAVCKSWNDLTQLVSCDLPVGTKVVIGPTQSATCPEGCYASSIESSVFVADPAALAGCQITAWP